MNMFCLKNWLLAGLAAVCVAVSASEEYYQSLDRVETWLKEKYSETSLTYKARYKKLAVIAGDEKMSEEQKTALLQKEFPEAFKKKESPLIFQPPLSWNIHSLSLGYDITESATKSTREVDVLKAVVSAKKSEERSRRDTDGSHFNMKASAGADAKAQMNLNASFNPFKWFSGSGLEAKIQASGGIAVGMESATVNTELWSVSQQRTFASERTRISEMLHQQGISHFHLTFTMTLTNNTGDFMKCRLQDAYIPVYMGTRSCNKPAVPYGRDIRELVIEPHRSKDIIFRLELDTTTARALAEFMAEAAPTIDVLKGGNLSVLSRTSMDVIGDSRKITDTVPVRLNIPGLHVQWKLRQKHTSDSRPTTLREALTAIGEAVHDWKGYDIFRWDDKELVAVSDVPFGKFAEEDKTERYFAFLQIGNKTPEWKPVSASVLERPLPKEGVALWVVDLGNMKDCLELPMVMQKVVFEKVESLADAWRAKAVHQRRLGVMFYGGFYVEKNLEKAFKWWRKAAEQGDDEAQFNLGWCYANGAGVTKDLAEAVKWYRKAADQGVARAQHTLGWCYGNGAGVTKDLAEAEKWFRKAAEQGYARAQFNLGACYASGYGVEKNLEKAVKWYRKAAEQGDAIAQFNLGVYYAKGNGVEKNLAEAVKWYRKAAEQGDAKAQNNLGWCYEFGNGVEKNPAEAVEWYRKAAEQGDAIAQFNLGGCYASGYGVEKNLEKAVKWYRKAAEQGDAKAQNNLGWCYEFGNGVEKNPAEAVEWYRKAAAQGNKVAIKRLRELGE